MGVEKRDELNTMKHKDGGERERKRVSKSHAHINTCVTVPRLMTAEKQQERTQPSTPAYKLYVWALFLFLSVSISSVFEGCAYSWRTVLVGYTRVGIVPC